jgi:hypothetical protein
MTPISAVFAAALLLGGCASQAGSDGATPPAPKLAQAAPATAPLPTPYEVIVQLRGRMHAAGEVGGRFYEEIGKARRALRDYAASGGDPAGFVAPGPGGLTPLLLAARLGYPEIVADLLEKPAVAARVNDTDDGGFSPWLWASFASQHAFWLCNPTVFKDPFRFVPLVVQQPYYVGGAERPYRRTRRLLEAAGAKPEMAAAKSRWLELCKLAEPEIRAKVTASDDLLATLEAEAPRALAQRLQPPKKP